MNVEPWSTVGVGSSAAVVPGIQYLLRAHGHAVAVDGAVRAGDRAAVSAFQTAQGVPSDGVVGPITWPRLVIASQRGSTGDAVRAVQQFGLLRSPGDTPLAVDGDVRAHDEGARRVLPGVVGPLARRRRPDARPGRSSAPSCPGRGRGRSSSRARRRRRTGACSQRSTCCARTGRRSSRTASSGPRAAGGRRVPADLRATEISTTLGQLDWPSLIITVKPGRRHGRGQRCVPCRRFWPE